MFISLFRTIRAKSQYKTNTIFHCIKHYCYNLKQLEKGCIYSFIRILSMCYIPQNMQCFLLSAVQHTDKAVKSSSIVFALQLCRP